MREEQTKSKKDKGARKRSCLTTSRQLQENFTKELSLKLRILFPKENKSKLIPNFTFFWYEYIITTILVSNLHIHHRMTDWKSFKQYNLKLFLHDKVADSILNKR